MIYIEFAQQDYAVLNKPGKGYVRIFPAPGNKSGKRRCIVGIGIQGPVERKRMKGANRRERHLSSLGLHQQKSS